jgi:hypothetical protein
LAVMADKSDEEIQIVEGFYKHKRQW